MDTEENSIIANYYSEKHFFVTGATGFMGKVLIEKLLRSCPNLAKIYILVRPKKSKTAQERIDDIINSPVFEKIRNQPNGAEILKKLQLVNGDITETDYLGLTKEDRKMLESNVEIVFHMAANVRFDQPLKPATILNTGGTLNLLNLAINFKKLAVFVHVSTSYCHCDETVLEEKFYRTKHNPRQILDMVTWLDDDLLAELTPKLIGNSPNTYAYTKALTENLLEEFSDKLPIVITRPSIIAAAWREPIPGWTDSLNGPTGLLVGAGKGVIRSMHCNPDYEADVVPVDTAINSLIVIGWKVGSTGSAKNGLQFYNVTANKDNMISWGESLDIGRKIMYDYPFSVCLWYPDGSIKSNYYMHVMAAFFFHVIPAYFIDFLMVLTRNEPFLLKVQKRVKNGLDVLQYYTTRKWYFHNENLKHVWEELNETDRKIFYTTELKMDFKEYLLSYVLGVRKYCVHEELETLPHARKVLKRLYYLDRFMNILLLVFIFWFFSSYSSAFLNKIENSLNFSNFTHH